ncbi:hypothetical protein Poli38472_008889 [Pythium oligandrum]|uniref:Uncharacterized protein n=1 Tax=Pythium oligandrum TaxID=41045 RepID=A0A8K1C495_PYTOL|nr:hypothetical protein Poli38472_008889 [Pythium oligandrum]|eukprot:TMW56241.1 hypothetical protein Poli38472_008889 [Pythium oligandrum]
MAVQVQVHGAGVRALRVYLQEHLSPDQRKEGATRQLLDAKNESLTVVQLHQSVELLKELRRKDPNTPTVRSLLAQGKGSSVKVVDSEYVPAEEPSEKKQKYLDERREHLLRLDEEMRYGRLVKNVKKQTASGELQRNLTSVKQHLSIGANMVVARIVAFIVIYMISRPLTDNETTRMIAGLGGAIGMMFIEMVLFIARAAKYDSLEQEQHRTKSSVF